MKTIANRFRLNRLRRKSNSKLFDKLSDKIAKSKALEDLKNAGKDINLLNF